MVSALRTVRFGRSFLKKILRSKYVRENSLSLKHRLRTRDLSVVTDESAGGNHNVMMRWSTALAYNSHPLYSPRPKREYRTTASARQLETRQRWHGSAAEFIRRITGHTNRESGRSHNCGSLHVNDADSLVVFLGNA